MVKMKSRMYPQFKLNNIINEAEANALYRYIAYLFKYIICLSYYQVDISANKSFKNHKNVFVPTWSHSSSWIRWVHEGVSLYRHLHNLHICDVLASLQFCGLVCLFIH